MSLLIFFLPTIFFLLEIVEYNLISFILQTSFIVILYKKFFGLSRKLFRCRDLDLEFRLGFFCTRPFQERDALVQHSQKGCPGFV